MLTDTPPRMLVSHTIASIDNAASGPAYSVPRLAVSQADQGMDTELLTLGDPSEQTPGPALVRRFRQNFADVPIAREIGVSFSMWRAISAAAQSRDILHTHGLWLASNILPGVAAGRAGARAKLVCSPRGMLGAPALRFSAHKKRLMWALAQGPAARAVHCWHATAESEYDDIRAAGLEQPVCIIPNGIDLPALPELPDANDGVRTVLSLGRLHPKKGLDRLIDAWALLESNHPAWRLRIVGPAERDYDQTLRAKIASLGLNNVTIQDALFGDDKRLALANADLFVLPSLHENFAMTVAEALSLATPVISTRGAPWSGLEEHRCGWWIDHGSAPLAAALNTAMAMGKSDLSAMGHRGRAWMARDFTWTTAADNFGAVYRWVVSGGEPPASVRVH